jgi:hypothetical protein
LTNKAGLNRGMLTEAAVGGAGGWIRTQGLVPQVSYIFVEEKSYQWLNLLLFLAVKSQ